MARDTEPACLAPVEAVPASAGLQTGLAAVLPCRARREMDRPVAGLMMGVLGIVFIVLGVLIALWPPLLSWLVATASILAGSAMLMMAFVMGRRVF
jgi:uncharacterized membrane protein HdeD (DUF308 family)